MKITIFALITLTFVSSSFAANPFAEKSPEVKTINSIRYEKFHEDKVWRGYVVVDSKTGDSNVIHVSARLEKKYHFSNPKPRTYIMQDYVMNCKNNTFHLENITEYWNYEIVRHVEKQDEKDITDTTFSGSIKNMFCETAH